MRSTWQNFLPIADGRESIAQCVERRSGTPSQYGREIAPFPLQSGPGELQITVK